MFPEIVGQNKGYMEPNSNPNLLVSAIFVFSLLCWSLYLSLSPRSTNYKVMQQCSSVLDLGPIWTYDRSCSGLGMDPAD